MHRTIKDGARARGAGQMLLRLLSPSVFFLVSILWQELFVKLYCFRVVPVRGLTVTALFSVPISMLLGLWCALVRPRTGRRVLLVSTMALCAWMATQITYYHLFKTFLSLSSLFRVRMVAGEFGGLAFGSILRSWKLILMECLPLIAVIPLRGVLIREGERCTRSVVLHWLAVATITHLVALLVVLGSGEGPLSPRHLYFQSDATQLSVTNFGVLTNTRLEFKRLVFGVGTQSGDSSGLLPFVGDDSEPEAPERETPVIGEDAQVLPIDFEGLIREETDETLLDMHRYFASVPPTRKNEWTGRFEGKNLVWIVAEAFSSIALDPELTPTLYRLSHEGFVCSRFYVPLWGLSTSDGEYAATTGLIPEAGAWSYLKSAENYMPFGFGNQFRQRGYRTLAFHNNTYTYYGRDQSYPNMGYEYYGLGSGLEVTRTWPESDVEMMELSVPRYVNEERFLVYYLTVSGHLNYNTDQNDMAAKHWAEVEDLPYSESVRAYLATQIELDRAVESLLRQLDEAGRLKDTVIVLSGDHYPYGLQDAEISELLGHEVDPDFERYQSALIRWSADMEEPVIVEKYCCSLDIMPTLANLFALPYDSRLLAGRDILSDAPGLAVFFNCSFLSGRGAYRSTLGQFTPHGGPQEDDEAYVSQTLRDIRERFRYSALILDEDYYRVLFRQEARDREDAAS